MGEKSENPYRHGVLVGNHVEDRFGQIIAEQPRSSIPMVSTAKSFHNKYSSVHNTSPEPVKGDDVFVNNMNNPRGLGKHLLFGHGPTQDHFDARDFRTSYDLTMNNKVPAHQTVESHFRPPAPVPRPEGPPPASRPIDGLKPKAYNDFTRSCDAQYNKIGLRK